jgi:hypothetical protein
MTDTPEDPPTCNVCDAPFVTGRCYRCGYEEGGPVTTKPERRTTSELATDALGPCSCRKGSEGEDHACNLHSNLDDVASAITAALEQQLTTLLEGLTREACWICAGESRRWVPSPEGPREDSDTWVHCARDGGESKECPATPIRRFIRDYRGTR